MSLLHKVSYTNSYTLNDDSDGLKHLLWSQFMCKCGICDVGNGKRNMERLPVLILEDIAREERMRFDIELAYVCKGSADKMFLSTVDSHRVGLAVKIRIVSSLKRIKLIRGLIMRGVTRFRVTDKSVYFDCDDLKAMTFSVI